MAAGCLAAVLGATACTPERPYAAPGFPFMARYRGAETGAPVLLSNADWWQKFDDPALNRLVGLALQQNLSLEIARERVIAARAELGRVPAAAGVTGRVDPQVQGSDAADAEGRGTAELGLDWMLDPWGERRGTRNAAAARIEVADAERDAAQLLVLYNLANAYVDLRYQQRIQQLRRGELAARRRTLALTEARMAANAATRLEITRSEARVAEIEAQLPAAAAAIAARLNEIAVLAGQAPGQLPFDPGTGPQPQPRLSPDVGIPADLLRNRPDIRIAERSYYAALAEIDVARAALYPRLSLTGAITLNAREGGNRGTEYYFGPALQLPLLPTGAARAGVDLRASEARQAHGIWKSTVLNALLEVENALLEYRTATETTRSATRAARLYGEARDLTQEIFQRGEATLGDLIDAEQEVSSAEDTLARTLSARALGFIALNVRLGSGHAAGTAPPSP